MLNLMLKQQKMAKQKVTVTCWITVDVTEKKNTKRKLIQETVKDI